MTTILLLLVALAVLIASVAGFAAHNAHQSADLALRKCEHLRVEIVRLEVIVSAQDANEKAAAIIAQADAD